MEKLILGDCLERLKELPDNSVDSLVTDPPAGIGFMGKEWDSAKGGRKEWCAWMESVMAECLRVLKPGGHGLVWAIPRTSHWTATALEDAGFEIRDCITHLFGSGFPKSLDVSKAIDKAAGAAREVIGPSNRHGGGTKNCYGEGMGDDAKTFLTAPATDAAKQWQGWGTALKPAAEFWWLVRKPISEKTVAANVLKWGTGALNIDASRIEASDQAALEKNWDRMQSTAQSKLATALSPKEQIHLGAYKPQGRFPANLVLSHSEDCTDEACDMFDCPVALLDAQSGKIPSSFRKGNRDSRRASFDFGSQDKTGQGFNDSGGASRFFYCAKISSSERNAGLEGFPDREGGVKNSSGRGFSESDPNKPIITKNHHPTVKPKKLMGYLINLITPPGGVVLDPFMGSGSTGVAAKENWCDFIGIEKELEYFKIAKARIENL